ncbi:uncharacterized protein NMK_2770 [Novimethylophilus kurashikiensis]|uniref:Uncharacterized protein n=1 Tax=Novimethylophilus kurashikiensis TaxID=1825523 RepID=A0A2R5FAE1_9PROT|nr:hypothetical protein [Novimethylophilus kurashikiensis]GBG15167.1 uncharacterized protein NMK_2770 [Novimethylophilus kurashikiensis]
MSLLSPDHLRIGLGASYAVMARVRGVQVVDWHMQQWAPAASGLPWQQALSTVSSWLAQDKTKGQKADVVLSSELAPMQLLPWREDVVSPEQQALLASAQYRRIYGDVAAHWKVSVQPTGYAQPWLSSAADERLLTALDTQLTGVKVHSTQPLVASLFNPLHKKLATSSWLLIAEPERVTALLIRQGQWQMLQTFPTAALQAESAKGLLLRELRLAGLEEEQSSFYTVGCSMTGAVALDVGWSADASIAPQAPMYLLGGRA